MSETLCDYFPKNEFFEAMVKNRADVTRRSRTAWCNDVQIVDAINTIRSRRDIRCEAANIPYGIDETINREVLNTPLMREPVSRCVSYRYFAYSQRQDGKFWDFIESYDRNIDAIMDLAKAYQFEILCHLALMASCPHPSISRFATLFVYEIESNG